MRRYRFVNAEGCLKQSVEVKEYEIQSEYHPHTTLFSALNIPLSASLAKDYEFRLIHIAPECFGVKYDIYLRHK